MCTTTDSAPMVVGQFYPVQVAYVDYRNYPDMYFGPEPIPLAGPPHDDAEYIGISQRHYHVDWRFVPEKIWLHNVDLYRSMDNKMFHRELGRVIMPDTILKIETKHLRMMREFRAFPFPNWLNALQDGYADKTAKNGICPHKGFDLNTLPADSDGCVMCPLHGLKFNTSTWNLVKR